MDNIELTDNEKEGLSQEKIDKLEMKLTIEYEANNWF